MGLALRGPIYSGIPTSGIGCCSTHRGSSLVRSRLGLLSILGSVHRTLPRMKGVPLRQAAQLSGLDLLYDPAHPSQFGLSQNQLVLRLYDEQAWQVPPLP